MVSSYCDVYRIKEDTVNINYADDELPASKVS